MSFRIPQVPVEWLDSSAWRLPSGKALVEFAMQAGFVAPLLLGTDSAPWARKGLRRRGAIEAREAR